MIDIKRKRVVEDISKDWLRFVKTFFSQSRRVWIAVGNRRIYYNSYAEKLKFQCRIVVFAYTGDKRLRKATLEKLKIWWQHFDEIILATPVEMEEQVRKWDKVHFTTSRLLAQLQPIFESYYDIVSKQYGRWLVDELNIKTCPYCNRQFIHSFMGQSYERPELDHFFPKAYYPLYCLSFYNLVPVCHACNHVKHDTKVGLNPYKRSFRRHFVIADEDGRTLSKSKIYQLDEKDIRIKFEGRDADEEANVEVLGLENVYNKHKDYVKELIDKSMAYDRNACQVLINSFQGAGSHPEQVYDFVWGRHLMEAEYEDRPLSKLTKEILDQLNIHR